MATLDALSGAGTVETKPFSQRADELFDILSIDGSVSSDSAGLVVAVAHMDLVLTQEEIINATNEILPSSRTMFTKEEFLRFLELVRPELPEKEVEDGSAADEQTLGVTDMCGGETEASAAGSSILSGTAPTSGAARQHSQNVHLLRSDAELGEGKI